MIFPRLFRRAPTMEGLKQVSRAISEDNLPLALRRIDKLSANTSKGVTERRKAVHTALAGGRHE